MNHKCCMAKTNALKNEIKLTQFPWRILIRQHSAISVGIGLCCIMNAEHPLITGWRAKSLVAAWTAIHCNEILMTNENEWAASDCFCCNSRLNWINILISILLLVNPNKIWLCQFSLLIPFLTSLKKCSSCHKCHIILVNYLSVIMKGLEFALFTSLSWWPNK